MFSKSAQYDPMTQSYVTHTHCSTTWLIYTRHGLYHVHHDCPRSKVRQWVTHVFFFFLFIRHDSICKKAHDMTHGLISTWQDSLLCDVSHLYMTRVVSLVSRILSKSAWCDPMTQSYVAWLIALWRDSFKYDVCLTWLIALWRDSFFFHDISRITFSINALEERRNWLVHMWHDSFIHIWHDSFIRDMTCSPVTWLIYMWHDSFICDVTHYYVTELIAA